MGPIFGNPDPAHSYNIQDCAYAVIPNEKGELAVVRTPRGLMLIGGSIEKGETERDALFRESVEETGFGLQVRQRIGNATQYVNMPSKAKYRLKRGVFFIAEMDEKVSDPIEMDHEFLWMPIETVQQQLVREFHRWAVAAAFDTVSL